MREEEMTKNIKEFMEKHGIEGFIQLYFAKYLFNLIKFQLKSKIPGSKNVEDDPGFIFSSDGDRISKIEDVNKYENEIYELCKIEAKNILIEIKSDGRFKPILEGKLESIDDSKLEPYFEKKMHAILEKLSRRTVE